MSSTPGNVRSSATCTSEETWTWQKEAINFAGPVATTLTVAGILIVYAFLLLHRAHDQISITLKKIAAVSALVAIVGCVMCYLIDPGSPAPDPADPAPADENDDTQRTRVCHLPDGRAWKQKWCRECKLWRPYRCGHCKYCGRCVLSLDHHCFWMGTCIGERNIRFFAIFLLMAGIGMASLTAIGIHRLTLLACWEDERNWIRTWEPLAIAIMFCCCPPTMCVLCGGVMFPGLGLHYCCILLLDLEQGEGAGKSRDVQTVLLDLSKCSGPRRLCCGPALLRSWTWTPKVRVEGAPDSECPMPQQITPEPVPSLDGEDTGGPTIVGAESSRAKFAIGVDA